MALPSKMTGTFSPQEIYFQAEDEIITILPRQALDSLDLIGFDVPKLVAMRRAQVPLWLALILKKQSRCNIVIPQWLEEGFLREAYDKEMANDGFAELPLHWLEIGLTLLENASDDIENPAQIRHLIQDIREVRQAKTRAGMSLINEWHIQMDNLGMMEMNTIRPFMVMTMDRLIRIQSLTQPEEEVVEDDDDDEAMDEQ